MNRNQPLRRNRQQYSTPQYLTVYEMGRVGVGVLQRVLSELRVDDFQGVLTVIERRINEQERTADGRA